MTAVLLVAYKACLFASTIFLNMLVCCVLLRYYKRMTFLHRFLFSVSLCEMGQAVFGVLPSLLADVMGYCFTAGKLCVFSGAATFVLAVVCIIHLTVLSVLRAFLIKSHFKRFMDGNSPVIFVLITCCYGYGFVIGLLPAVGAWSRYEVDVDGMRCSLDWTLKHLDSLSYIITCNILCFLLPVIVVGFSLYIQTTTRSRVIHVTMLKKRYLKRLILSTVLYFFLWTPYAVVGLLTMFKYRVPGDVFTVAAVSAKLCSLVNPVVNCFVNSSFRRKLYNIPYIGKLIPRTKRKSIIRRVTTSTVIRSSRNNCVLSK